MTTWNRNAVRALLPAVASWSLAALGLGALEWAERAQSVVAQAGQGDAGAGGVELLRLLVTALLLITFGHGGWVCAALWRTRRVQIGQEDVEAVQAPVGELPAAHWR